jgi:hypothetical protein
MPTFAEQLGRLDSPELKIMLSNYRGPYAANDFTDVEVRQTDEAVINYLEIHAAWLPWRRPRRILLQFPNTTRTASGETATSSAYRAMLEHRAARCRQKMTNLIPKILLLLTAGLTMLYLSNHINDAGLEKTFRRTLADAVRVGGWVALWTVVALLYDDGAKALMRFRALQALARLPIEFDYRESGGTRDSSHGPFILPQTDVASHTSIPLRDGDA